MLPRVGRILYVYIDTFRLKGFLRSASIPLTRGADSRGSSGAVIPPYVYPAKRDCGAVLYSCASLDPCQADETRLRLLLCLVKCGYRYCNLHIPFSHVPQSSTKS